MQFFTATALLALASHALAHDGPHEHFSRSEISRRSGMSKRCAAAAASLNEKRYVKRQSAKRNTLNKRANSTVVITTEAPYYEVLQNDTCILTPEVTSGPYLWPRAQTLRQDMSEGQDGIPFYLDIGVLDMATCEPLTGVLVDLWHCNATGSYSSFTGLSPNTEFKTLLSQLNVTDFEIGTTDLHTDDSTWLRGMWPTDQNGMMEMKSIVPGFYVQRAIHIRAQVHTNWTLHDNGTLTSGSNLVSTGQIYLNETISEQLMALEPYVSHTQINRTTNAEDSVYYQDFDGGYNPVLTIEPLDGADIANGIIGYITIGVDTLAIETTSISGDPDA